MNAVTSGSMMYRHPCRMSLILALLALATSICLLLLYIHSSVYIFAMDIRATEANLLRLPSVKKDKDNVCDFPEVDPFNPAAMKFYEVYPTTSCADGLPTITYFDGKAVTVNQTKKFQHYGRKTVQCWYRSLTYQPHVDYITGPWLGPFQDTILLTDSYEYVEVKCNDDRNRVVSKMHHYATHPKAALNFTSAHNGQNMFQSNSQVGKTNMVVGETVDTAIPSWMKDDRMNVLLVGIDSMSKNLFKRSMPKTREFMTQSLQATEMLMYNKVGDNTFPNLLAIIAGIYESDIPGWNQDIGFDQVPFIWKDFKSAGYRTQYVSDRHDFDTFSTQPTDSYNLPMVRALMRGKTAFDNNCFEDQVEIKLWLDLVLQFTMDVFSKGARFFSLAMFKRPTHDFPNQASAVDDFYLHFFQELLDDGLLKNTFLILFGDHGPRTGQYRKTFEGSIEERAPLMMIYVPRWFRNKYPLQYNHLLTNAHRLTTNFDIHKTLQSLVTNNIPMKHGQTMERGLSLFSEIPVNRTCDSASILPHFCLCNGGLTETNSHLMDMLGKELVYHINHNIISCHQHGHLCAPLTLCSVISLVRLDSRYFDSDVYRIIISTDPGEAEFEATIAYKNQFILFSSVQMLGLISRINTYRYQSQCVAFDTTLRMYCYCKDIIQEHTSSDFITQEDNMYDAFFM